MKTFNRHRLNVLFSDRLKSFYNLLKRVWTYIKIAFSFQKERTWKTNRKVKRCLHFLYFFVRTDKKTRNATMIMQRLVFLPPNILQSIIGLFQLFPWIIKPGTSNCVLFIFRTDNSNFIITNVLNDILWQKLQEA